MQDIFPTVCHSFAISFVMEVSRKDRIRLITKVNRLYLTAMVRL